MGDGGGLEIFYIVKLIFAVAGLVGGLAFGTIGGLNLYTHGMKTIPETLDAQMNVAIADRQLPSDVDLYFLVTGIGAFGVGYMYLMKQVRSCAAQCPLSSRALVQSLVRSLAVSMASMASHAHARRCCGILTPSLPHARMLVLPCSLSADQMCDTCEESCDERRQRFVKSTTVKRH
tara:strand:- start:307 stop:834 length:528 start_codon:yes stop_codon:yes gene_type:complete